MQTSKLPENVNYKNLSYETCWKAIIRPYRDLYDKIDLGEKEFTFHKQKIKREDYQILSYRGFLIKCSFYRSDIFNRDPFIRPVVIYLHGNSSSRLEGKKMLKYVLDKNMDFFIFDFPGCGQSEGHYISLGYHEQKDIKKIIDFIEKLPGVGNIGLWGRSMGAATTLLYSYKDKRIKCICLDSPFSDFKILSKELCQKEINIPGIIIDSIFYFVKKTIQNKNKTNLEELKPYNCCQLSTCNALFIHAMKDELIPLEHTIKLYESYAGKKTINIVEGGHNTIRQNHILNKICNFFYNNLKDE